jgi:hypothetical protein
MLTVQLTFGACAMANGGGAVFKEQIFGEATVMANRWNFDKEGRGKRGNGEREIKV